MKRTRDKTFYKFEIGCTAFEVDLLPTLFRTVVVPEQVYEEVIAGGKDDAAVIISVEERLQWPRDSGLYLSDSVNQQLVSLAGE